MLNRTRPPPQNAWGADMLTGTGLYANNQAALPPLVFDQINALVIKAWKSVPTKGEVRGNLTKIIQKAEEPFSDFVARMVEAAGRLFDDPDAMMPMLKQLIFEQATKEFRDAITPHKTKGLESWLRVCREVGGPLSNSGLAAAVVRLTQGVRPKSGACYGCGQMGHLKKACPNLNKSSQSGNEAPGVWPRCRKGKHWANECYSTKDADGQALEPQKGQSKNGKRGPSPQGPKMYGATEMQRSGLNPQSP